MADRRDDAGNADTDDDDISRQAVFAAFVCLLHYRAVFTWLGLFYEQKTEHQLLVPLWFPRQACALLDREDDQAPRSFSEFARHFARQSAVLPVETPTKYAGDNFSEYSRSVASVPGLAVVSR